MLIFDLVRLSTRTFRSLFSSRAAAGNSSDDAEAVIFPRTGLFASPASVGLITGVVSAAINLLPTALLGWTYFNRPVLYSIFLLATVGVLCSGPYLLTLSAVIVCSRHHSLYIPVYACGWHIMLPPFLIFQMRFHSLFRISITRSMLFFRIAGSYLLGTCIWDAIYRRARFAHSVRTFVYRRQSADHPFRKLPGVEEGLSR